RCSLERTPCSPPGGWWSRCWAAPFPFIPINPARGAPPRPSRSLAPPGGTTRPKCPTNSRSQPRARRKCTMAATKQLTDLGQPLWPDDLSREPLTSGTLARYIRDWSISGLTSNPATFDHAIGHTGSYDDSIRALANEGLAPDERFFGLALEDLRQAADLFRPIFDRTGGLAGWASF